ncbi:VWA domain-containing protein [Geoglobus ahangari]
MNSRGVSILVEYLLLMSIVSFFVILMTLQLNDQLKEVHLGKVVENQFSDVSAEISSQIVDILTIAPSNGYVKARIYMPDRIGDREYFAGFKEEDGYSYVYIESEDGKYQKYLGLGGTTLYFQPRGITNSLSEEHVLEYSRKSVVFPSAVLILRPAIVLANETSNGETVIDVSKSSAYGWWNWKVELWNGTKITGDMGSATYTLSVVWNETEFVTYCNYDSTNYTAYCNLTLTVSDLTYNLNDTDTATLVITKNTSSNPDLYIRKFVIPPQVAPGEPFEIHIYLQGRGFLLEGRGTTLSVVHVIDTSGSMDWKTKYDSFSGYVTPSVWNVQLDINSSFLGKSVLIEVYTTDDLSPWWDGLDKDDAFVVRVEQADGDVWYANGELGTLNGRYFYDSRVTSSEIGIWNISTLVAIPEKPIPVTIEVYRYDGYWNLVYSTTTTYTANYSTETVQLPENFTRNDLYDYLAIKLNSPYYYDFLAWATYSTTTDFCYDYSTRTYCLISPAAADNYTYYVVPYAFDASLYEGDASIQKLDSARIAAITFDSALENSDYVGLVDYSYYATKHTVNTSGALTYLTTNKTVVDEEIKDLSPSGATNIYHALNQAKEVLLENTTAISGTKPLIILMSDGEPTWGSYLWDPADPYTDPRCDGSSYCVDAANRAIDEANTIKSTYIGSENITICTIAFGYDANTAFLQEIASTKPDGSKCFYTATNYQELVDAYNDISKTFKLSAKNVTITDVIPSGLELVGEPTVSISGNATADVPIVYQLPDGTAVRLNISEVYINDEIELVFQAVANKPGDYQLDVYGVSNVTYEPYPFTGDIAVYNLTVVSGRVSTAESAVVEIS